MKLVSPPAASHHEVQVEVLPVVSKVPETLQVFSPQHHGEVVLVGAPEQLLVGDVVVRLGHGPGPAPSPEGEDEEVAGRPEAHVCSGGSWHLLRWLASSGE